jgi:hypothetical protein
MKSGDVLSKVLIRGFGSKAGCVAGADRRFTGIALSANSSTKSLTMNSLVEKSFSSKLGPWGNKALGPDPDSALFTAIDAAGPLGASVLRLAIRSDHQLLLPVASLRLLRSAFTS